MPRVIVKMEKSITLVLSEAEAVWLKNYLQNNQIGEPESEQDNKMRYSFFEALANPEIKNIST